MGNEDQIVYLCAYSTLRQQLVRSKRNDFKANVRKQFEQQLMNRNRYMDLSVGAVDQQLNPQ